MPRLKPFTSLKRSSRDPTGSSKPNVIMGLLHTTTEGRLQHNPARLHKQAWV